jgi:hypothetical protein
MVKRRPDAPRERPRSRYLARDEVVTAAGAIQRARFGSTSVDKKGTIDS